MLEEATKKFSFETSKNGMMEIPLEKGSIIYVLGPNGSGKSGLMQRVYVQNRANSIRILAHRQIWFADNAMDVTPSSMKQIEDQIKINDTADATRYKDIYAQYRSAFAVTNLINAENTKNIKIASAVREEKNELLKELIKEPSLIQSINELFAISNISIEIVWERGSLLFAKKKGFEPYSIAELSDGERSALIIGADVLTAKPETIIIIDEPERHLHRSIISPLLTTLFDKRNDCVFIIATHDIQLPIDNPLASILLIRGCNWNGKQIMNWDADLISASSRIPEPIEKEILGPKRKLLFVEGDLGSLDKRIYELIYPEVTVLPQGNCVQVEKAVIGLKETNFFHWIKAYGLIDADDRTETQKEELFKNGIVCLPYYSVEAIYYHLNIIAEIAKRQEELFENSKDSLYNEATKFILEDLLYDRERLCSILCSKKIKEKLLNSSPKPKDIQSRKTLSFNIDANSEFQNELANFDKW